MDTLRPYQEADAQYLAQRSLAACFNEQRTGKTPTICRVLILRRLHKSRVLIVAPKSSLYVWANEYTRWTGMPATVCRGTQRHREYIIKDWEAGALLISYDSLKLIRRGEKTSGDLQKIIKRKPQCVILDEAHRIRSRTTACAKAAFALSVIPNRYILTGTPAPGKPDDVWALLHFLFPKYYTSYWNFVNKYFYTAQQVNYTTGKTFIEVLGLNDEGRKFMLTVLPKFSTQRKRKEVMPWLQDVDRVTVKLPLSNQQKKYLDELAETWETEEVVTQGILDRLIRYRQICLDPGLLKLEGSSPKTTWILDYLEDYPEQSVIIFSKFTSYLYRLNAVIKETHDIIVGDTPAFKRAQIVEAFQKKKIRIVLIQIDTGKEALTLDTADTIIFTDRFPPCGDLEQAEARFIATTPDRANKLNLIYSLVMEKSYDEDIQRLITSRATEVDVINNFKKYMQKGD